MVLEAVVDPNILSCAVPIIMRGRERSLSGKIKPAFGYRSGRGSSLVVGRGGVYSLALGRDGGQPLALGRGGVGPEASGETKPNFRHLGKERSGALVHPEVFNVRWLLVPPSGVSWY